MSLTILKRERIRRARASIQIHCPVWRHDSTRAWLDVDRFASSRNRWRIEPDGGAVHDDDRETSFTVYTSDEYLYHIEYPAGWVIEENPPGGMVFDARDEQSVSAFVIVENRVDSSLDEYVDGFFEAIAADEYIYTFERRSERATTLPGGQPGVIIEYTYTDDARCERWCCTYLFVLVDEIGYTVGVEWVATGEFERQATRIVDSFALLADTHTDSDDPHREQANFRMNHQQTDDKP